MVCPFCRGTDTRVVDKRDNNETNTTRRRRECQQCGKRFTTYERMETINLFVRKRSGKTEEFDREKLKRGIKLAARKGSPTDEQVEEMVQDVEQQLLNHESTEIDSQEIGQMVLEALKQVDPIDYLLFASVFRGFEDIEDLKQFINTNLNS